MNFIGKNFMSKPVNRPGVSNLLTAICFAFLAAPTFAQNARTASLRPDPLDATAPVPAVVYRSSLGNYRALEDEKVANWKETNDTTGRVGGWRAYAKEARQPDNTPKPPAEPAANTPDKQTGHDGHKMK